VIDNLSDREKLILTRLADEPNVSVSTLGRDLGVSEVTIRTDLKSLAAKGHITRTHGGATPAFHKHILERQQAKTEEKNRIAKAAAELVQDGDTIMVLSGTTTALLPKYLLGKGFIRVVTDSTLLLPYVRMNPNLSLTVLGGEFRSSTESFVGPAALEMVKRFNVNYAFIGTDGFSIEKGLTTHLVEVAELVRAMTGQATKTVLMSDSSKYGRAGFATIMPLAAVDILITDSYLDPETQARIREQNLEIVTV